MARSIVELQTEITAARDAQNTQEVRDLAFLIDHQRTAGIATVEYQKELRAARNRQNSRRYARKTGRGKINVGDEVTFPNGEGVIILRIEHGAAWGRDSRGPVSCPLNQVRLTDKAVARASRRATALEDAGRALVAALVAATEWEHVDAARATFEIVLTPAQGSGDSDV